MSTKWLKELHNVFPDIITTKEMSYHNSITLYDLINKLQEFADKNEDKLDTPIYFDNLHINGKIINHKNYLELY